MDKILGFLPDADPTLAGVLTDCTNLIPYEKGMQGAPSATVPTGVPVLAAACIGASLITKLDDTRRLFAGTTTKLYELSGGTWVDVARASPYTGGVDTRWSFAQFGDATLAANLADVIQRSNGSGAFADVATAPKAKIIFSVGAFVMALNTVDGTYGTSPDRWWCSAQSNDTDWTPSVSTLATTGRLVSAPGRITAGGRLGEYAVAYKERAIYVGQFVPGPAVWDWLQVAGGDAGCVGQDAWCDVGGSHFVAGQDNFWRFDGTRPTPIGSGKVRQWFYNNSSPVGRSKTQCVYDRQNDVVWIFYCSKASASIDSALVYHIGTEKFGKATIAIESAINYISSGITIDGLASVSATIDGLAGYSFDSQYWLAGGRALSVFSTAHQLSLLTGVSVSSDMTTGDAGNDETYSLLNSIRLRYEPGSKPATAMVETFIKQESADPYVSASTSMASDGKFDVLDSARWHKAKFSFTGDHKVTAIGAALIPEGDV